MNLFTETPEKAALRREYYKKWNDESWAAIGNLLFGKEGTMSVKIWVYETPGGGIRYFTSPDSGAVGQNPGVKFLGTKELFITPPPKKTEEPKCHHEFCCVANCGIHMHAGNNQCLICHEWIPAQKKTVVKEARFLDLANYGISKSPASETIVAFAIKENGATNIKCTYEINEP